MISTITWNNNNGVIMDPIKLSIRTTDTNTKESNSFELSDAKYRDLKRERLNNYYYAICSIRGNNNNEHPHEEEKESKKQRLATHGQLFSISENMMQNFYSIPVQYSGVGATNHAQTEKNVDLAFLQFQSFFENIKIFFSHNSAVYESALKYILEFITIYFKDLAAKGVNLSTATDEDLKSCSSVINSSLQALQVHVAAIFCGYQPLILEFSSHCYPAKKIMELKSAIGYELYAFSKIKRKNPAEEVKLSWQAFTRYLSLVRETLPPLEFFSWLVSVEQVHHVALNPQCDLYNKLQLLNNAAGFLHCFPAAVRNILLELYPLPVPLCVSNPGIASAAEEVEAGYCIDDRSELSDQLFRRMVKEFVDALLSTFGRAHYQIFRYLYEIIHPFFSAQSNEGFYSMVASLRVLFKHARVTLERCLDFIRKQFLYRFYTYVANTIFTSMRSGTDLKLKIDEIALEKNRNDFFSQVSVRSQAALAAGESADASHNLVFLVQDLERIYSVHRQGLGSTGIVAVLQRMNDVISKSKEEKIIPKIFTLFPLEAKTAKNLSTNLPKAVAPLLVWNLPSRDMANQALLIKKLIIDSSESIQVAANSNNGSKIAFGMAPGPLAPTAPTAAATTARASAGRLMPKSFLASEPTKQVVDLIAEGGVCTAAAAAVKKPAAFIVPIENASTTTTSAGTTIRLSPVCGEPGVSKKVPIEVTTAVSSSAQVPIVSDEEGEDSAMRVLCNLAAIVAPQIVNTEKGSLRGDIQKSTDSSSNNNPSSFGNSNNSSKAEVQLMCAREDRSSGVATVWGPFRFEDLKVSYEALKMHAPASVNGEQVQLSYQAALLRKLESVYNHLILCETADLKSRSPDCNGRCTSPIPLEDGSVIRVNKDDVKQWIEKILRDYTAEK